MSEDLALFGDRLLKVHAPYAARAWKPGQFFRVKLWAPITKSIPLAPCRVDPVAGLLFFLIKVKGPGTRALADLQKDEDLSLMGPVGTPLGLNPETDAPLFLGEAKTLGFILGVLSAYPRAEAWLRTPDPLPPLDRVQWHPELPKAIPPHAYLVGIPPLMKEFEGVPGRRIWLPEMQCLMQGMCGRCLIRDEQGEARFGCHEPYRQDP